MFTDTRQISEEGAWVHIKDAGRPAYLKDEKGADDKSKPIRVKMLGPDSETLQKRARQRVAARMKRQGEVRLSKMSEEEIVEMMEHNSSAMAENMADATIDWENMPSPEGGTQKYSPDSALKLYQSYPAIPRQLQAEGGSIEDFMILAGAR